MLVFYDQLNRAVTLPNFPTRIVSLVPSQTELLFDLGLEQEIIGITKFCIHPYQKTQQITNVGGTKQLNALLIHQLHPDLIIANKEENEQIQIEDLMRSFPVWISDINDLADALDMINKIGQMTGHERNAATLANNISQNFKKITPAANLKVAYLIWRKPYMVAGTGTFINTMLKYCGLTNVINSTRYPEVTIDELITSQPDVLLLSSEPYPFKQKHVLELQKQIPNTTILLVNGEMFSWYGSRLLNAPAYFNSLIRTF